MSTSHKIPLSILDLAPVAEGSDVATAFSDMVALAQHADALGYNRYWMADTQDLDGNARIVYGTVDMGCYEIQKAKGTIVLVR